MRSAFSEIAALAGEWVMSFGKAITLVLAALFAWTPQAQAQNVGSVQLTLLRTTPQKPKETTEAQWLIDIAQAILPQELEAALAGGDGDDPAPKIDYFMTAYPPELAAIIGGGKWQAIPMDGQIFVYDRWVEGTVPLYRFRHYKSGQHFFTWNREEARPAVWKYGFMPEGICCYISPSPTPDTVPLYRLRRTAEPGAGIHRYVTNEYEQARLVESGVWVAEGIAGFVWPKATTAALHAGSLEPLCFDNAAANSAEAAKIAESGIRCVP
jgi:hypothetical protein